MWNDSSATSMPTRISYLTLDFSCILLATNMLSLTYESENNFAKLSFSQIMSTDTFKILFYTCLVLCNGYDLKYNTYLCLLKLLFWFLRFSHLNMRLTQLNPFFITKPTSMSSSLRATSPTSTILVWQTK
jgi:hypothetical protein